MPTVSSLQARHKNVHSSPKTFRDLTPNGEQYQRDRQKPLPLQCAEVRHHDVTIVKIGPPLQAWRDSKYIERYTKQPETHDKTTYVVVTWISNAT